MSHEFTLSHAIVGCKGTVYVEVGQPRARCRACGGECGRSWCLYTSRENGAFTLKPVPVCMGCAGQLDFWRDYLCTFVQPANWDGYTILPRPNPLMSAVMEEYREIEAAKMRAENQKREAEAHDVK